MKYLGYLASLIFYIPVCFAPIIPSIAITDIDQYLIGSVPHKTILVFDIDDVIGIPDKKNNFTLVEQSIVSMINSKQQQGYYCCALTARGPWSHPITFNQLSRHAINFKASTPFKNTVLIPHVMEHKDGIAYVAQHSKGAFLSHLIQEHKLIIEKIVFIDDKYHNLVDVEQAMRSINITHFTGLHYTRAQSHSVTKSSHKKISRSSKKTKKIK